ncbi:hypothetical protein EJ02DRAFT_493231 [Clathrospora elynae]|uniref:Uncharacterized protein n=1 Tax=Clathrospora elynae TaxID=706981 RepID=A0A6A5SMY7_9PLEO|nr:hypothetical protein EJ02DRAFT_493231 [Clathrospora elynae]
MEGASDTTPQDPRQLVGDPQQGLPNDTQVYTRTNNSETANVEISPTNEGREIAAQQQPGENDEDAVKAGTCDTATDDSRTVTIGEDATTKEQKKYTVKLKINTPDSTDAESANENTKPSDGSDFVIQEPEDVETSLLIHDTSPRTLGSNDLHIKNEHDRTLDDDHATSNSNLSGPDPTSDQINPVKNEPEQEQQRSVGHSNSSQSRDDIITDGHESEHAMHVPDNDKEDEILLDFDMEDWEGGNPEPVLADATRPTQKPRHEEDHQSGSHTSSGFSAASDSVIGDEDDEAGNNSEADAEATDLGLTVHDLRNQRYQAFSNDAQLTGSTLSPPHPKIGLLSQFSDAGTFSQYQAPRRALQQPTAAYDQRFSQAEYGPELQHLMQIEERKNQLAQQLEAARYLQAQHDQQGPNAYDFNQVSMDMRPAVPMAPMNYRDPPTNGYQQVSRGQPDIAQYPFYLQQQHSSHMLQKISRAPIPPPAYSMAGEARMSDRHPEQQGHPFMRQQVNDEHDCADQGAESDDNETLRSRVKRHPLVMRPDSGVSNIFQSSAPDHGTQVPEPDYDSDIEFLASKPKFKNPIRMQHPIAKPMRLAAPITNAPASDEGAIDWSLPTYEVQRQPLANKDDVPRAKVSIRGLVREELMLSPDHFEQETHLLLNVFIPGQQALAVQDPMPATALLNFHTIAIMVIEAYVQFEIGDELGMGRGHLHQQYDYSNNDYERVRNAKDADVDDIFFAVIDRWRAGIASNKQPLRLVRGAQEFCDVALDVIYYIKDNGLLLPEPKVRRERSDKGVKRGPRARDGQGQAAMEGVRGKGKKNADEPGKGIKRGTAQKPHEVQPRKKAKVEVKKPRAKKAKAKEPPLTVVRK